MPTRFPFIFSAHHAGNNFGSYAHRVALTHEQRIRYSDYGTELTVPQNGAATFFGAYSRGLVDLNREPGNHDFFRTVDFAQPRPNKIWLSGRHPTQREHAALFREIYTPYHAQLLRSIRVLNQPAVVIAWDNTAHYAIGRDDSGRVQHMKPFILSNMGAEGSTDVSDDAKRKGERPTCAPAFLEEVVVQLRISLRKQGLPTAIYLNHVFKGGYVAERYNTLRHPELDFSYGVQSFQVEYCTALTHDQSTLHPNRKGIRAIQKAFEEALAHAYTNYFLKE